MSPLFPSHYSLLVTSSDRSRRSQRQEFLFAIPQRPAIDLAIVLANMGGTAGHSQRGNTQFGKRAGIGERRPQVLVGDWHEEVAGRDKSSLCKAE